MSARSDVVMRPRARARRAVVTAVLAISWTCGACATEPDTIRLLEISDSGSGSSHCQTDAECPADHPWCEPDEHRCVECLLATECAQGMSCSITTHTCQSRCSVSADCAGLNQQPVCNSSGACVQCASDTDCAGTATPRCNLLGGVCVECVLTTDCNPRPCFDDCLTCFNNQCMWRT